MKKENVKVLLALFCVLSAVFFWGCGGSGPGAPGSGGSADTGIEPRIVFVTHFDPNDDQGDVWLIDLFQQQCDATTAEVWGDDFAAVTFNGLLLNPNVPSTNELHITDYRVRFSPTQPGLPPIEEIRGTNQAIRIVAGEDTVGNFLIMDFGRKIQTQIDTGWSCSVVTEPDFIQFCNGGGSGTYPVFTPLLYNMKLEMWGKDRYGNDFTVGPIERTILIANYDHC